MKRSELKAGMLVELRNGDIFKVVSDNVKYSGSMGYVEVHPISASGFSRLYIDENLLSSDNSQFDIMKVYTHEFPHAAKCIFERVEIIREKRVIEIEGSRDKIDRKLKLINEILRCKNVKDVVVVDFGDLE